MMRAIPVHLATLLVALAAGFAGCSAEQKLESAATTAENTQAPTTEENSPANENEMEIKEALAKLSPEDRALAEKQETCPVTGERLGSMGAPIKVTVKGREVFVCCEGCVNELRDNFAKYEEKLPPRS
jgi:hypothetical protein